MLPTVNLYRRAGLTQVIEGSAKECKRQRAQTGLGTMGLSGSLCFPGLLSSQHHLPGTLKKGYVVWGDKWGVRAMNLRKCLLKLRIFPSIILTKISS